MTWLLVALIGGVVGLDGTAFPQAMFSRPIVAGPMTGLVFGRPVEGALIGAVLEAFALVILPVGAAKYPEVGLGAVAATAAYLDTTVTQFAGPVLLLAILFGLGWERVGGLSVRLERRLNERLVAAGVPLRRPGDAEARHLTAMGVDLLRGAALGLVGSVVGAVLLRLVAPLWLMDSSVALGVLGVAGTAMIGALLPLFGGWTERRLAFLLGILCGSVLLLLS